MSDEENGEKKVKRVKAEHLSIAAIVLTLLGGGAGVGLNVNSNATVAKGLEELKLTLVEVQGTLKANDADKARIMTELSDARREVDKMRDEFSFVKARLAVLESKVK